MTPRPLPAIALPADDPDAAAVPARSDPNGPVVQLFVNPHAGSSRRRRIAALRTAFEAAGARVILTPSLRGRLEVADGVDHVCAVGGDGTVRYVAAAVGRDRRALPMSVYPLGTVNLLARECGYSPDPAVFVERALATPAGRRHYTGLIGETLILNCASIGPDSMTVDRLSPRLKRLIGRAAYGVAFCRMLGRWPRHQLRVVANGEEIACEAVYVAKGRYFAGDWSFAAAAAVDAPLLHVVALRHATRTAMLRFAWSLLRGRDPDYAIRFTCTELTIRGDAPCPVQADGDIVAHLPVRITLAKATLAFA
jgi:diacylglycerol kinase family enzyme